MPSIYFSPNVAGDFYAGDYIDGKVYLEDIKGVRVRRFIIELIMERYAMLYDIHGAHEVKDSKVLNYLEIHGEKVYDVENIEYKFKIKIPEDATPSLDWSNTGVRWYLKAKLDLPFKRDISGRCPLTVYNSMDPKDVMISAINSRNKYMELTMDKNIFEFNEDITGSFKILKIPGGFRSVDICLKSTIKVRLGNLIGARLFKSIYNAGCVRYMRGEVRPDTIYNFKIKPYRNRPITYRDNYVESNVELEFKINRRVYPDIRLKIPIIIYHRRGIKTISKEGGEDLDKLISEVREVMNDGKPRDIIDLRLELGFKYKPETLSRVCERLVKEGYLEIVESGMLLKKYRIKRAG